MGENIPCVLKKLNDEMNEMSFSTSQQLLAGKGWKSRSIYRLPAFVTNLESNTFNPQIVSIGPYHHGDENLAAMEEHKRRALFYFLKRSKNPLQRYVDALIPVVHDLRDAYDHLDLKWQQNNEEFLKLMILDGCFILEILSSTTSTQRIDDQNLIDDYDRNDTIFSNHGKLYMVPFIKRDMLMLENQLPLLVLEKLVNVQMGCPYEVTMDLLTTLILNFLFLNYLKDRDARRLVAIDAGRLVVNNSLHMLDIYRKMLVLGHPRHIKLERSNLHRGENIVSASELDEFGIKLRKNRSMNLHREENIIFSASELAEFGIKLRSNKSTNLSDISFHDGFLYVPLMVFNDTSKSLYKNMIAFERFHFGAGNEVSSYVFFMSSLINSPTDVTLLQLHGIVQNDLGSNEAVVNLINSLSMGLTLDRDDNTIEVRQEVHAYCMRRWGRWRAKLIRHYFNDPKDTFNIQLAIFLFIFTSIQTIFTVLSYTR